MQFCCLRGPDSLFVNIVSNIVNISIFISSISIRNQDNKYRIFLSKTRTIVDLSVNLYLVLLHPNASSILAYLGNAFNLIWHAGTNFKAKPEVQHKIQSGVILLFILSDFHILRS